MSFDSIDDNKSAFGIQTCTYLQLQGLKRVQGRLIYGILTPISGYSVLICKGCRFESADLLMKHGGIKVIKLVEDTQVTDLFLHQGDSSGCGYIVKTLWKKKKKKKL